MIINGMMRFLQKWRGKCSILSCLFNILCFYDCKNDNVQMKSSDFLCLNSAKKIDCGYLLVLVSYSMRQLSLTKYPQFMF